MRTTPVLARHRAMIRRTIERNTRLHTCAATTTDARTRRWRPAAPCTALRGASLRANTPFCAAHASAQQTPSQVDRKLRQAGGPAGRYSSVTAIVIRPACCASRYIAARSGAIAPGFAVSKRPSDPGVGAVEAQCVLRTRCQDLQRVESFQPRSRFDRAPSSTSTRHSRGSDDTSVPGRILRYPSADSRCRPGRATIHAVLQHRVKRPEMS